MPVTDLESIVTLAGFAVCAVALLGYLAAMKRDLRAEIAALGTGLHGRVTLEQRTFEIGARRRPGAG